MSLRGTLALLAVTAAPALAQDRLQAASNNAYLAMNLCLQNYADPEAMKRAFAGAGFRYEPEDFGDAGILHWYHTPDGTVQVTIVDEPGRVECRIGTPEWGVEAMIPFVTDNFRALTGGVTVTPGSPEGRTVAPGTPEAQDGPCTAFHVLLPRTMLNVIVERQGNDGTCMSDGTSVARFLF